MYIAVCISDPIEMFAQCDELMDAGHTVFPLGAYKALLPAIDTLMSTLGIVDVVCDVAIKDRWPKNVNVKTIDGVRHKNKVRSPLTQSRLPREIQPEQQPIGIQPEKPWPRA